MFSKQNKKRRCIDLNKNKKYLKKPYKKTVICKKKKIKKNRRKCQVLLGIASHVACLTHDVRIYARACPGRAA